MSNNDRYKKFAKLYKSFYSFGLIPKEICKVLCKIFGINKSSYYKYLRRCRENGDIDTTYESERERKHQRLLNNDEIKPDEEIREVLQDFVSEDEEDLPVLKIGADIDELTNLTEPKKINGKLKMKKDDEWVDVTNIVAKPTGIYPNSMQISLFDNDEEFKRSPFDSNTPTIIDEVYKLCYSRLLTTFEHHHVADDMYLFNYGLYTYFIDEEYGARMHLEVDIQKFADKLIDKWLNGPNMAFKDFSSIDGRTFDKDGKPIKNFVVLRIVKTNKEVAYTQIEELDSKFKDDGYNVYMITDYYSDFNNIENKLALSQNTVAGYMIEDDYKVGLIIVDGLHNTSQLNNLKKGFSLYSEPTIIAVMKTNKKAMNIFRDVILDGERVDISKCSKTFDKVKTALAICDRVMVSVTDRLRSISTEVRLKTKDGK